MGRIGERIRGLVNVSGGIGYHLAALRYVKSLWRPFREDLGRELSRRIPSPELTDLVIVGPSGGYCLMPDFLGRFRSITAVDIDPLAGVIFRKRAPNTRFIRQDFFVALEKADWDLRQWLAQVDAPPSAVFLFSNVLGQLGFLHSDSRMAEIGEGLRRAFSGDSAWFSFHDRFSVKATFAPRTRFEYGDRPSSRALANAWTGEWPEATRRRLSEIEEHEIGPWITLARGGYVYLPWPIESRRIQLIEVCGRAATRL